MILRLLLRFLLTRTWLLLLLLLGALSSAWYGLSNSLTGMQRAPWVMVLILGLLVGWSLARTRLKTPWAILLLAVMGLLFTFIFFAKLAAPLLAFLRLSLIFGKDLWRWRAGFPDPEPLFLAWNEITGSLNVLFFHLERWTSAAYRGEWIINPIATSLVWSLVFWMAAGWAAWAVRRLSHPLAGLAPLGLLLAFLLNYTGGEVFSLLGFIGCLLLLMAVTRLDANELRWLRQNTDYASDIGQDLGLTAGALTVAIVFLAGAASILPTATLDLIESLTDRYRYGESGDEGSIARSLGIQPRAEEVMAMSPWVKAGLPRQHLLGSGPELSERVVMTVRVFGQVSGMASADTVVPRYYWRSLTYDQYSGQGWASSFAEETAYPANGRLINVSNLPGNLVTIEFDPVEDLGGLLYATGQLITANQDYILAVRPYEDSEDIPLYALRNAAIDIFGAQIEADPYQIETLITIHGIRRLRTTGIAYPQWIRQRYLALPLNLPDRVIAKALELTEDKTNPYDKAAAIETYLRTIPYSLDIPAPPLGQDVVDAFLFDIQQGYCDYYATAMAVLARAAGLPSRLVVGYASGTYDPANNRYVVTEADAHSWVEIFFAGRGWVEFEPTASLPAIERPEDQPEMEQVEAPVTPLESKPQIDWGVVTNQGGLAAALLGALILLTLQLDSLRLQRMPPGEAVKRIYRRMQRSSRPLTGVVSPSTTPNEFVEVVGAKVRAAERLPLIGDALPPVPGAVRNLTQLFNRAEYSSHSPTRPEVKQALKRWRDLRWRLWLGRFAPKGKGKGKNNIGGKG